MSGRPGGLWRHRDFVRLWTAQTVSVFGSLITGTALSFTAVLLLDATPLEMALLTASGIAPALVAGIAAGVWVDRLPKRPLMVAADIGRALVLVSVPVAWAFDALTMEQLYAVALTTGVMTIAFDVAYQAYLPALVSRDELIEGNSKLAATSAVSEFGAFGAGGWLVQLMNGPLAVLVDATTFVVSALFVRSIEAEEPRPAVAAQSSFRREAADGMRLVQRQPVLRAVAGATALYSLGFGVFGATYMIYVTRSLGFEPGVLGMIFALGGGSSLLGALLAGRTATRVGVGPAMALGLTVMGVSMFLIPAATGATVAAGALLIGQQLVGDGSFTVYDVNEVSLRQSITSGDMLGRVNSVMRILNDGGRLGGALAGGLVAELVGLRAALMCGAGLTLSAGAWIALSPVLAVRAAPAPSVAAAGEA
jgi:MFS family permease